MPAPRNGESRSSYVSRYMGSKEAKQSFPNKAQRAAVAYSEYRAHERKARKGQRGR